MSVDWKHEKQLFLDRRKEEKIEAAQYAALQLCCGIDLHQILSSPRIEIIKTIENLDRIIKRERLKGLTKHWSYDLNRHIALKEIRNRLILMNKENTT